MLKMRPHVSKSKATAETENQIRAVRTRLLPPESVLVFSVVISIACCVVVLSSVGDSVVISGVVEVSGAGVVVEMLVNSTVEKSVLPRKSPTAHLVASVDRVRMPHPAS